MYQPPHHREDRLEVQHALIRAHPLGTLVTMTDVRPCRQRRFRSSSMLSRGPFGTLQAHLARANPQWRDFDPGVDALVIFQGRRKLHHAVLVCDEAGDRKGRADLELCDRPGLRAAAGDRGPRLAGDADRGADGEQEGGRAGALGGDRRAGGLRGGADQGHRRDRNPDRPDRRQVEGQPEPAGADREGVVEGAPRRGRRGEPRYGGACPGAGDP